MYQIVKGIFSEISIQRLSDNAFIPSDTENIDCTRFLADWKSGAEVKDYEGASLLYSDDAARALGLISG